MRASFGLVPARLSSIVMSLEAAIVRMVDLDTLIRNELGYFDSAEHRNAFSSFRIEPVQVTQRWQYGHETHDCFIVARSEEVQIVYCASGFGPSFPWSVQRPGELDLGMDSEWYAYLYECFICSDMWHGPKPAVFKLMGPGERAKT
jgi:hypothetical protein